MGEGDRGKGGKMGCGGKITETVKKRNRARETERERERERELEIENFILQGL